MYKQERLNHLLQREVSTIITQKVDDPRINFATISRVTTTPDLKNAKLYVSIYGSHKNKKNAIFALNKAKSYIRFLFSQRNSELREIPEFSFFLDEGLENSIEVFDIIEKWKKEKN